MTDLVVECRVEPFRGRVPARFGRPGHMREVSHVLDRWEGEDHRYFRVRVVDGSTVILRQDLTDASWRLHFYRRHEANAR